MKNIKLLFALIIMATFSAPIFAQNGQSVFSQVSIYDNLDGTGTIEARLTPNGQGITVTEIRLRGGRVGGLCVLSGTTRATPWSMNSTSGPGNSGSTTLVVNFPMVPASGNGPDFLQLEADVQYYSGNHFITDRFSAGHQVRQR